MVSCARDDSAAGRGSSGVIGRRSEAVVARYGDGGGGARDMYAVGGVWMCDDEAMGGVGVSCGGGVGWCTRAPKDVTEGDVGRREDLRGPARARGPGVNAGEPETEGNDAYCGEIGAWTTGEPLEPASGAWASGGGCTRIGGGAGDRTGKTTSSEATLCPANRMDGPPPQSGWVLRIGRGAILGLVRCVGEAIEGEGGEGFFQNMTKSSGRAIRAGRDWTGEARQGEEREKGRGEG